MTEAKFALSFNFTTIRGDNYQEFVHNCQEAFGPEEGLTVIATAMSELRNHYLGAVTTPQAVQTVTGTLGAQPVPPQVQQLNQPSSVFNPPAPQPQPQYHPAVAPQYNNRTNEQAPAANQPPSSPYPGDCAHGPKKYVPAGVARQSGKPYPAFWACQGPQGQKCR